MRPRAVGCKAHWDAGERCNGLRADCGEEKFYPLAPRGYLAGPMRGLPNLNAPTFAAHAAALREKGYDIYNPAEHEVPGMEWPDYLREDLKVVVDCDVLFCLRGWQQSQGARLEVYVASALGIPVMWADTCRPVEDSMVVKPLVKWERGA